VSDLYATVQELAARAERVAAQIKLRVAGEPIPDRLASMFDPDARPIRKGKLGKPNEFGYAVQVCELTPNAGRGASSCRLPPSWATRQRASCSPRQRASSTGSSCAHGR
jgi:IS5 family transposase